MVKILAHVYLLKKNGFRICFQLRDKSANVRMNFGHFVWHIFPKKNQERNH